METVLGMEEVMAEEMNKDVKEQIQDQETSHVEAQMKERSQEQEQRQAGGKNGENTKTQMSRTETETEKKAEQQPEEESKEYVERKRWLFFGLPFTFTKYTINEEIITIDTGLLNTVENDCYLYKVQDVELKTSLIERIFRLGTVACYTGDNTHPQLYLEHVKHAKEIKNYILKTSEEARRKRRTLNTLNIDADDLEEM